MAPGALAADQLTAPRQETGVCVTDGKVRVRIAELYYRPAEVDLLIGDPRKAVQKLGWNPKATVFQVRLRAVFLHRALPLIKWRVFRTL
jgi:GDP-D-mannose dehydratase